MTDKEFFTKIRPILRHAPRKQIASLFLALLDYLESGKLPQRNTADPKNEWFMSAFLLFKERIDDCSTEPEISENQRNRL